MEKKIPSLRKMNWLLFLMGLVKIPMIGYVRPKLLKIDTNEVQLKIRLRRKTKNHLNSMYFGALAVGADIAAGIHIFYFTEQLGWKTSFSFKAMKADFLQRAESDVLFICSEGVLLREVLEQANKTKERINQEVKVVAYNMQNEPVAEFLMEVSVKVYDKY